jgi:hypothetical protein
MCNIIKFVISCNTLKDIRDKEKVKRFKDDMKKYFHVNIKDDLNDFNDFNDKRKINLFVKTISGKTITLYINEDEDLTIDNINDMIFKKEGIPKELLYLIYGGKVLESNKKMSDYKIVNNSTIHMNIRINKIL